ncbi:cytochrome P450 [Roridomyces roridus]|uniref:Cytochrome P450 n=1 Tax=Roridomyces roridus TaxID=1738132 RepID=A0AAD7FSV3_9AGAR|nr:cytochrome P450 [Roridomyces roridus]
MGNMLGHLSSSSTTAVFAAVIALVVWSGYFKRSAVGSIPGPPSPSWLYGHMIQLLLPRQYGDYEFKWQSLYGAVYRLQGCFGEDYLMVSDPLAMQSIINSPKFEHSSMLISARKLMFHHKSLIASKGENHRRLRTAFNPSFSAAEIRRYEPLMEKVAAELSKELEVLPVDLEVDILPLVGTATLGAISEVVFGCPTRDLGAEFVRITARMMRLASSQTKHSILRNAAGRHLPEWFWDLMTLLPNHAFDELRRGRHLAGEIGEKIVAEKIGNAKRGLESNNDVFSRLLGLDDNSDNKPKLSEEEVAANTSLMVIAGQDTTTNVLCFGLLQLARSPQLQEDLRREIHSSRVGSASVVYNNMPLLNALIKETLRLHPVLAMVERIALDDTVLPLSESITTSDGTRISQIPIQKGQVVSLAITSYQRLESLWGPDAHEFKPSRWIEGNVYKGDAGAIGPYANLLAFFGGERTCLGWRFALLEMQVIISELVAKFSFALPDGEPARMQGSALVAPVLEGGERGAILKVTRML